mgnify:CR=1 FL=1
MAEARGSGGGRSDEWRLVTKYDLTRYPCGAKSGERVRLRRELVIRHHTGEPTGEVHAPGEVWTVLRGVADDPDTVWLREPNGDSHTWDNVSFWEWFERVAEA